jgi:GNAT superfamily N-acetyltransferase
VRRRPRPAAEVVLRPTVERDRGAIEQLVSAIAAEVYGHLFPNAPPQPDGRWAQALVAEAEGRIVGVMVADDDWIEDLWVAADWRRRGVGARLLTAGERQIAGRGLRARPSARDRREPRGAMLLRPAGLVGSRDLPA